MKIPISVYLLKDDYDISKLTNLSNRIDINGKRLFFSETSVKTPDTLANFFQNNTVVLQHLKNKSFSACLFTEVIIDDDTSKAFLLSFGYGSKTINKDYIISDFGLKIVLNSCNKHSIRKVSRREIAKNSKLIMGQTPKSTSFQEFGFEPQNDLLSEITAYCEEEWYVGNMTGKENLSLSIDCDINTIDELLADLYAIYIKDDYKTKFSFLDKINIVKSKTLINVLDTIVANLIKDQDYEKVYLAIPEFFNWTEYINIKYPYQKTRKDNIHTDICIEEFFENFDETKFDNLFSGRFIIEHNADENKSFYFDFRDCILAEIEHENKTYCMVNGDYYQVNNDFKSIVDVFYENTVEAITIPQLVECTENAEGDYIKRIETDDLISLDKNLVYDGYTVEICDMISTNKEFLHIKKYYGANALSHLFFQGLNSVTLLKRSNDFVDKVNEKLEELGRDDLALERPFEPREYKLIFVILSKNGNIKPPISFFSKLSLKNTIEKLSDFGISVYVSGAKLNISKESEDNE